MTILTGQTAPNLPDAPRDTNRSTSFINPGLGRILPREVCHAFTMIPIGMENDILTIAIADVNNDLAGSVASHLSGYAVQFVEADAEDIEEAIDLAYAGGASASTGPEGAAQAVEVGNPKLMRTGELLVWLGMVTEEQVSAALAEQLRTGARLGEILTSTGAIQEDELLAVLSEKYQLQRVDLDDFEPTPEVAAVIPEPLVSYLRVVPVHADENTLYLATSEPLGREQLDAIKEFTPLRVQELLATRSSIEVVLQRVYGKNYVDKAVNGLRRTSPVDSAHTVLSQGQKVFFLSAAVIIVVCAIFWTMPTLIVLTAAASLYYLAVSVYRLRLVWNTIGKKSRLDVSQAEIDALDEHDLPIITILVPLYREAAVVPSLVHGISGLDYPKTKLDVKLLCEVDDDETVPAIRKLKLPSYFKLMLVPDSQPKTKPKACNYGLFQAEGKYVTIFDAEDRPDANQMKKVVAGFEKSGENVVCIQSKLNYFNQEQNLLTKWFSIEYATHFDLILPGLDADQVPIPLGGTSNYFNTEKLRDLGAWDPYNVTEDADLGMRLQRAGYRTAVVDSTTLEEANSDLNNWVRQRSRWIKGYLQTWLVHMRNPIKLLNEVGLKSFLSFNLVVGGTFTFLLNPIFWALTTLYLFTQWGFIAELFPGAIFYMGITALFVGNFLFIYVAIAGTLQRGMYRLTKYALTSPIYWGLVSWAAWKGFIQLFTNPFYWEKTIHGLDNGPTNS